MELKTGNVAVIKAERFYAEISFGETDSGAAIVIRHFNSHHQVVRTVKTALLDFNSIENPMRVLTQYGALRNPGVTTKAATMGGGGLVDVE